MRLFRTPRGQLATVFATTVPWLAIVVWHLLASWGLGVPTPPSVGTGVTVLLTGVAVLGSSFLLAWAAETAEKDVPRPFALAVLAVLAVAPEYAVDGLYAWNAGAGGATLEACRQLSATAIEAQATPIARACHEANLAVANMTGANRILIGLGWSGIALYTIRRAITTADPAVVEREGWGRTAVQLDPDIATEIAFLLLATAWAFLVPLGGGIDALDTIVLVGLYVAYIGIVIRGDVEHDEDHVGVPVYLQELSKGLRIGTVLALFTFSGAVILLAVEPFAHGLESLGTAAGIPSFFMIQWIAPLASESPELIVVILLVNKARSTAGFNALISSKLNQWTLLIGTLVVVYSLALGEYGVLPFDSRQSAEIWLTAAQSLFALAILSNLEITVGEAYTLLALFLSQVLIEFSIVSVFTQFEDLSVSLLLGYTVLYVLIALALLVRRRADLRLVLGLAADTARTAVGREPVHPEFTE